MAEYKDDALIKMEIVQTKNHLCEECNFSTHTKKLLGHHRNTKHTDNVFTCDICHYETNTKINLKRHIRSDHEKVLFSCEVCNKKFSTTSYLYKHKRILHKMILNVPQGFSKKRNVATEALQNKTDAENQTNVKKTFTMGSGVLLNQKERKTNVELVKREEQPVKVIEVSPSMLIEVSPSMLIEVTPSIEFDDTGSSEDGIENEEIEETQIVDMEIIPPLELEENVGSEDENENMEQHESQEAEYKMKDEELLLFIFLAVFVSFVFNSHDETLDENAFIEGQDSQSVPADTVKLLENSLNQNVSYKLSETRNVKSSKPKEGMPTNESDSQTTLSEDTVELLKNSLEVNVSYKMAHTKLEVKQEVKKETTNDGNFKVNDAISQKEKNYMAKRTKKASCPFCTKVFAQSYNLRRHIQLTHEGQRLYCDKCDYSAQENRFLQKHMQTQHS